MFSFQKLAIFAVILAALWLGFRLLGNLERQRRARERMARPGWFGRFGRRSASPRAGQEAREADPEVRMVACRVCGDYVAAAGSRACGRADCPSLPPA